MLFSFDFRYLSERWFDEALPVNYDSGLTVDIGSGDNGTITIKDREKTALAIKVVLGDGNDIALSAAYADGVITVTLGTGAEGAADNTKNTAALVAAAINDVADATWEATASGTGATAITAAIAETALEAFEVLGTPCAVANTGVYDTGNHVYYVCLTSDSTPYNAGWIKLTPSSI